MPDPGSTSEALSCCAGGAASRDALLEALRRGDARAFEITFHTYKSMVYNLSLRILMDREEALDVSQEVFLTLHRKVGDFRGAASLKSWLFRVTYNRSLNRLRWWRRRGAGRSEPLTLLHAGRLAAPAAEAPDHLCLDREVEALVRKALGRLPPVQRAAVQLRDGEGCSYEEIARIAGVSVGTVKSRIARARDAIQRELALALSKEKK